MTSEESLQTPESEIPVTLTPTVDKTSTDVLPKNEAVPAVEVDAPVLASALEMTAEAVSPEVISDVGPGEAEIELGTDADVRDKPGDAESTVVAASEAVFEVPPVILDADMKTLTEPTVNDEVIIEDLVPEKNSVASESVPVVAAPVDIEVAIGLDAVDSMEKPGDVETVIAAVSEAVNEVPPVILDVDAASVDLGAATQLDALVDSMEKPGDAKSAASEAEIEVPPVILDADIKTPTEPIANDVAIEEPELPAKAEVIVEDLVPMENSVASESVPSDDVQKSALFLDEVPADLVTDTASFPTNEVEELIAIPTVELMAEATPNFITDASSILAKETVHDVALAEPENSTTADVDELLEEIKPSDSGIELLAPDETPMNLSDDVTELEKDALSLEAGVVVDANVKLNADVTTNDVSVMNAIESPNTALLSSGASAQAEAEDLFDAITPIVDAKVASVPLEVASLPAVDVVDPVVDLETKSVTDVPEVALLDSGAEVPLPVSEVKLDSASSVVSNGIFADSEASPTSVGAFAKTGEIASEIGISGEFPVTANGKPFQSPALIEVLDSELSNEDSPRLAAGETLAGDVNINEVFTHDQIRVSHSSPEKSVAPVEPEMAPSLDLRMEVEAGDQGDGEVDGGGTSVASFTEDPFQISVETSVDAVGASPGNIWFPGCMLLMNCNVRLV